MGVLSRIKDRLNRLLTGSFAGRRLLFEILRFLSMRGWELPFLGSAGIQNPLNRFRSDEYWRTRNRTTGHSPELYLEPDDRTEALFADLLPVLPPDASFLEIGCNAGRNLRYLHQRGYRDLAGIEINREAVETVLREKIPELFTTGTWYLGSAAQEILKLPDRRYDVVFSIAVLIHIPPEDLSLFTDMVRVSRRYIAVITQEYGQPYPYDFHRLFTRQGCKLLVYRSFYGGDVPCRLPVRSFDPPRDHFQELFLRVYVRPGAFDSTAAS